MALSKNKKAQVEKAIATRAHNDAKKKELKQQTFELKVNKRKLSNRKRKELEGKQSR